MAAKKKTLKIGQILFEMNHRLQCSTCSAAVRQGFIGVIEAILHAAGVYSGFGYLTDENLRAVGNSGEAPGIAFENIDGERITAETFYDELALANSEERACLATRCYPDETRRHYYVDQTLVADYDAARQAYENDASKLRIARG